ncbi:MAG TPA: SPOR domain-containing protein [Aquabacterium sp.]|uniref:SPOR domain-containing protein n=1 Tax=Aquabacterium sp. TaxID=1872578 RepID=UPI002E36A574|nr:SPOR domain-containing protein [Aquabacterium sp.]HEX5355440.1 SPOR domain-containing protein [Aquabacterium sp.]
MPLPSFLQRFRRKSSSGQGASDAVPLTPSDVEATRARARRRLVGMVVLVGAGVIGFPWLFETQPRSMSPDVQIVQGASEAGGDVQISGVAAPRSPRSVAGRVAVSNIVEPQAPASSQDEAAPAAGQRRSEPAEQVVDEPAAPREAASRSEPSKVADKPASKPQVKDGAKDGAKDKAKDAPKVVAKDKDTTKPAAGKDAARTPAKDVAKAPAKSDKPADKPADKDKTPTRYVVQFGAFADVNTAHEARMKVERLGLKTYTQQVDTPAGKRIRVRMGPYADKAEADKAMATLRKAGLSGAVLTL